MTTIFAFQKCFNFVIEIHYTIILKISNSKDCSISHISGFFLIIDIGKHRSTFSSKDFFVPITLQINKSI